jgi:hypothetical protein
MSCGVKDTYVYHTANLNEYGSAKLQIFNVLPLGIHRTLYYMSLVIRAIEYGEASFIASASEPHKLTTPPARLISYFSMYVS